MSMTAHAILFYGVEVEQDWIPEDDLEDEILGECDILNFEDGERWFIGFELSTISEYGPELVELDFDDLPYPGKLDFAWKVFQAWKLLNTKEECRESKLYHMIDWY